MEKERGSLIVALVLALLYDCQECVVGENSTSDATGNFTFSGCNYTSCGSSSFSKELRTALVISGGSAALGVGSVLALLAVIFACKRTWKRRRESYIPNTDQGTTAKRATTFRKKSMKGSQNGTPPVPTHNYETVLPNFGKKSLAPDTSLAQNYEVPLPKAATLPHDMSHMNSEEAGKDARQFSSLKISQSVKVRGTAPEVVYMNVKTPPTGEDLCAINPWNRQVQWNYPNPQGGNGTLPDASSYSSGV